MVQYANIDESVDINGNEYQIVVNRTTGANLPLLLYINRVSDVRKFGGYVYSINDRNHDNKVYQLTIRSGDNEEMIKNLSNLMCKKYKVPNYCNVNNLDQMDYNPLLMKLNELMK